MGDTASDLKLVSRRLADAARAIAHGCSEQRFYRAVAAAARAIDPTHPGAGPTIMALTELLDIYSPRVPLPPPVKTIEIFGGIRGARRGPSAGDKLQ